MSISMNDYLKNRSSFLLIVQSVKLLHVVLTALRSFQHIAKFYFSYYYEGTLISKSVALPTELRNHFMLSKIRNYFDISKSFLWASPDLNREPTHYECGALTIELEAHSSNHRQLLEYRVQIPIVPIHRNQSLLGLLLLPLGLLLGHQR